MNFRASGASTGRRAKPLRLCLQCMGAALPDEKKCRCGGKIETFDSTAEAKHFCKLKLRERAGEIFGLQCHPKFELNVRPNDYSGHEGMHVCYYSPDFLYVLKDPHHASGVTIYEDIKPFRKGKNGVKKPILTPDAALKIKLFEALYQTKVRFVE